MMKEKSNEDLQTFRKGKHIAVTFDKNGYIVSAQGFRMLMWWRVDEDIDTLLQGKHISELSNLLKKNCANQNVYNEFCEEVMPYYQVKQDVFSKAKRKMIGYLQSNCIKKMN